MPLHAHQSADVWTVCIITSAGLQRVINTASRLSSHNTFVPWVQSNLFVAWVRPQLLLQSRRRLLLRLHLQPHWRFRAPALQMSNSECSSLEDQVPGKLRFCKESAIQQRVQSSTGLVRRVLAIRYVLIPIGAFNPLIAHPDSTRSHIRGWIRMFLRRQLIVTIPLTAWHSRHRR